MISDMVVDVGGEEDDEGDGEGFSVCCGVPRFPREAPSSKRKNSGRHGKGREGLGEGARDGPGNWVKERGSHEAPMVIRVFFGAWSEEMEGGRKLQQTEMFLWRQVGGVNGARATPAGPALQFR